MAKQTSKEIYIRNLSEQDNDMLEKIRALTGQASNSQAILKAGYLSIKQNGQLDECKRYIAELEGKIYQYESNLKSFFSSIESLKQLFR